MLKPTFPRPGLLFSGRGRGALNFLTARSGLLICALFLLVGLALVGDYGIGADQATQRLIAEANLNYLLGRGDAIPPIKTDSSPLVPSDRYYGVAFELPLLLAERALGLEDLYYINRLRLTLTHLFFIIGGFFCYRLAYRLFNSRLIALVALLLFLLHPRLYGHSFFNSKDPPFISMFILALYLLERAFRKDTVGAFVLLGVAVGLLTNLRIMGIMLLPAVLAMRGLDLGGAAGGPERKGILRTGGGFLLAAGLTWYAVTPYAWVNPLGYLAESLNLTANHPTIVWQIFQGARIPSDQLPRHYLPTWFSITAPPLLLLLGGGGAAVVMARSCCRPRAVLRNGRRRFSLLLLATFLLPPLAVILLGSTQHDDWRHLYFIHAPGSLLAAGGLGGLAAALARRPRCRAGVYGLAGLGLGLILLQMTQLHPLQYVYFNFLVDRTTPEYLRQQYEMDFWQLGQWPALRYLLERHPEETLILRPEHDKLLSVLPPAARQRLLLPSGGRPADYALSTRFYPDRPDLVFNSVYPRRFYNNSLVKVKALTDSRMTAAAVAAYQELYRQAGAGDPIIRADYAVYLKGRRLTFVKENCPPGRRDAWFEAKVFPRRPENRPPRLGDPDAYASYHNHRVRLGAVCLSVLQLPATAQGDLILSQDRLGKFWPSGDPRWTELYSLSPPGLPELIAQRLNRQPPAGPDAFAVFLEPDAAGRPGLLYAKAGCSTAEYETPVFLQIYPENLADLPFYLWENGQDSREFPLSRYGLRPGGDCIALVPLPDYPVAALRTGQEDRWEVNLYPPAAPDSLRAAYAALSDRPPSAQAAFALYRQDNRLIYLRETCAAADTAAGFFLHIVPEEAAVLPAERRPAGFDNQDFVFERWGGHFDDKCLAIVPLPDYSVKAIRTGQHIPGHGELWAAELTVAP